MFEVGNESLNFQKSLIAISYAKGSFSSYFCISWTFWIRKEMAATPVLYTKLFDYMMGDCNAELCFRIVLPWNLFQLSKIEAEVISKSQSVL